MINSLRTITLQSGEFSTRPVLYWMSRDQRVHDNWALLYAQEKALEFKTPLSVVFCLVPAFLDAALRQYEFMIKGLERIEKELGRYNIGFHLLTGDPQTEIPKFISGHRAGLLVTDFSPLNVQRKWKETVRRRIEAAVVEVDAHNIVPCRIASDKQEFGAYTIRPKIHRLLPGYLTEFPKIKKHPFNSRNHSIAIDWKNVRNTLRVNASVGEVSWLEPGEKAASKMLHEFIETRLTRYAEKRNDPTADAVSNLSPYLHFGHISAQRVALEITRSRKKKESREAFLEELIVRRELSDNFCFYNEAYDSFEGFPPWAQKTLNEHRKDKREYLYSVDQFEQAATHDPLWNAAQNEMSETGKMHGYMRMYWCKKILEWTESPDEAQQIAMYLNDKYELDGRDPNGYAGIAWSIGGVHDRAWGERPVFGKIRYMNEKGCRRKFDVDAYIGKWRRE